MVQTGGEWRGESESERERERVAACSQSKGKNIQNAQTLPVVRRIVVHDASAGWIQKEKHSDFLLDISC